MRPLFDRVVIVTAAVACTTGVPAATALKVNGWARDSTGKVHMTTATPVPATAVLYQGLAFTPSGAMYVSNVAVGATSFNHQGFAIRNDGALHVSNGTPGAISVAGLSIVNNRVYVTGL